MKQNSIVIMILIAIVFGGGGFFIGKSMSKPQVSQFGNRTGASGVNRGMRGGQILGTILSADTGSITVQMVDGSSKIVLISGTTSINQAAAATAADLKIGERVSAFGQTNTDGSVTAQNIQINPIMRTPSGTPNGQ
jgi:hypothetical protein